MLIWRVPSFYGDIALERTHDKACSVVVHDATPKERAALAALAQHGAKKKWVPAGTTFGDRTEVKASIEDVAKVLAKAMKPGKKLVHAVKFTDGRIEEITAATFAPSKPSDEPKPAPKAATTVASPTLGCPAPDFPPAVLRARAALFDFLTPEQRADFERYNRFMVIGATTGHRYMLTSRTNRDALAQYHRTLFDLDRAEPLCVHDWDIPPEEELLALAVLIQLPGYENYCRHLES